MSCTGLAAPRNMSNAAGVGASTVEFKLDGSTSWLIELVSVRKSDAMRCATTTSGIVTILNPGPKNYLNQGRQQRRSRLFASQQEAEAAFASYPLGCREEAAVADGRSA